MQQMALEGYFDFLPDGEIRVKGTRIGIKTILGHYLAGVAPELVAAWYPELALEQIFATLTYYFANQERIDHSLAEDDTWFEAQWQQQHIAPLPVVERLRRLKRENQLVAATTPM